MNKLHQDFVLLNNKQKCERMDDSPSFNKITFLIHNKMKLYANKITPRMIGKLYRLALFSKTNKRVCFIATWPLLPQIYCLRFITASNICCFYHFKMNWFL